MVNIKYNIGDKIRTKIHYQNDKRTEVEAIICGVELYDETDEVRYKIWFEPNDFDKKCGATGHCIGYVDQNDIIMEDNFRLEVDTGVGGYGFTDTLSELMEDVEDEYGDKIKVEVKTWALNSKEGDEFQKYGMHIRNIGK